MKRLLMSASLIAIAGAGWAETYTQVGTVDAVTIYPGVAEVSRVLTIDVPAGRHEVIVPDLPEGLDSTGLRVAASDGAQLGAVNLAYDRLPVTPDLSAPEIVAARDRVEALEETLRAAEAEIAAIRLRAAAAEEQVAFLKELVGNSAGGIAAQDVQALAEVLGAEVLAARQAAFAAEQEALAAERALADDKEALADARQALAALTAPQDQGAVLTFALQAAEAGEVTVTVTTLEGFANWQPVYDLRLDSQSGALTVDRAVVISQGSGQDWSDVALTLSTARPAGQTAPSPVWGQLRRIIDEDDLARPVPLALNETMGARVMADEVMEEAALAPMAEVTAVADTSGAVVTYAYPGRVTIRDGVEDLRLPLDSLTLEADVVAEAVPARDSIAYRVASFTNDTEELLLPGRAQVFADGAMIGFSHLPLLAAGADTEMGFGPLDGLRLTRVTPNRTEGDRGVFSTTNQLREEAVITVENLTGQDWQVRLRDAVPYSEQEDLEVDISASPAITRRDPDGARGVLEWDLAIASGDEVVIELDYTLSWPEGYVLR